MPGLRAIWRKELGDHFGSKRFAILFALICLAGASAVYVAGQSIRSELSGLSAPPFTFLLLFTVSSETLPPFITFIAFLGPLVGLALAFDSLNGERNRGTMSRLLSQPIYRDSVINGKFLAGLTTVAVMLASIVLVVSGLGVWLLGLVPTPEEAIRLAAFLVVCVLYVGFWMSLATLFSLLFRQPATAALAGIAAWIFFTFFVTMITNTLANALIVVDPYDAESLLAAAQTRQMLDRLSPNTLFQEATTAILMPIVRALGPILLTQAIGMLPNPLPVAESLLLVWPQVASLLALTAVCFAVAYAKFMTEEIRAL